MKIVDFGIALSQTAHGPDTARPPAPEPPPRRLTLQGQASAIPSARSLPSLPSRASLQSIKPLPPPPVAGTSDDMYGSTLDVRPAAAGGVVSVGGVGVGAAPAGPLRNTIPGTLLGTPQYMSPEQIEGEDIDARSDQYALGCILYEMLTGDVPFDDPDLATLLKLQLSTPAPPLHTRAPELAGATSLNAIVMRMLAKSRNDRYATMREVERALEQEVELLLLQRGDRVAMSADSVASLRSIGEPGLAPVQPQKRRSPWRWGVPAGLLAVAMAGGGWYAGSRYVARPVPQVVVPEVSPTERASLRKRSLDIIREALGRPEADGRLAVLVALGQAYDPEARLLVEPLLRDARAEVRAQAAALLGKLGDREALPALRTLLSQPETRDALPVYLETAGALDQLGDGEGTRILEAALAGEDAAARQKAAFLLSERGSATALAVLQRLGQQGGLPPAMETLLLARLARLGDAAARERLYSQLGRSLDVSLPIAARLYQNGDERGRAMLRAAVQKEGPHQLAAARFLAGPDETEVQALCRRILGSAQASPASRLFSTEALGLSGRLPDVRLLAPALEPSVEPRLRLAAAVAILQIFGREPDALSEKSLAWAQSALSDGDWAVRQSAATVLGDSGQDSAVPILTAMLKDSDARVRVSVVQALGRNPSQASLQALHAGVTDPDREVRLASLRALSAVVGLVRRGPGSPGLLQEVAGWLSSLTTIEASTSPAAPAPAMSKDQAMASLVLLKLGDAKQRERLRDGLRSPTEVLRQFIAEQLHDQELLLVALQDAVFAVRFAAAKNLAQLADKRAIPVLREALALGGSQGVAAYGWLRKLGEAEPLPKDHDLALLLSSPEIGLRLNAVEALAGLPVSEAVPLLLKAAADPEPVVRKMALEVAADLPAPTAAGAPGAPAPGTPVLLRLSHDPDSVVRMRASALLSRLMRPPGSEPPKPLPPPAVVAARPTPTEAPAVAASPAEPAAVKPPVAAEAAPPATAAGGKDAPAAPVAAEAGPQKSAEAVIADFVQRGKRAYEQKEFGKAQKLLEKAQLQCARSSLPLPLCIEKRYDIAYSLGHAYEQQRRYPEAMTEYDRLLANAVSGLKPEQRTQLAQAAAQIRPRLGRVVVSKLVKGRCQETTLWTLPGTFTVNTGEEVSVRANQTVRLGACK